MQITDKDIQTFRERAKTELQSNGAVGRLAWDSVVDALCNEVEELRKNAAPGNVAALRVALNGVAAELETMNPRGWGGTLAAIRAALAAPARNCDVGTAEEQAERFKQFCLDNHSAEHLCSRCPLGKQLGNDVDICQLHWAQMPYASAEGKEADNA